MSVTVHLRIDSCILQKRLIKAATGLKTVGGDSWCGNVEAIDKLANGIDEMELAVDKTGKATTLFQKIGQAGFKILEKIAKFVNKILEKFIGPRVVDAQEQACKAKRGKVYKLMRGLCMFGWIGNSALAATYLGAKAGMHLTGYCNLV